MVEYARSDVPLLQSASRSLPPGGSHWSAERPHLLRVPELFCHFVRTDLVCS